MAKETIIRYSLRLNVDNKQHAMINRIIRNLNPHIYKSQNQFIIDALEFYLENFGQNSFTKPHKTEYVTTESMNDIKKEIARYAVGEAKSEIIRCFMTTYGAGRAMPSERLPSSFEGMRSEISEDDDVIKDNAMKWFGDDS